MHISKKSNCHTWSKKTLALLGLTAAIGLTNVGSADKRLPECKDIVNRGEVAVQINPKGQRPYCFPCGDRLDNIKGLCDAQRACIRAACDGASKLRDPTQRIITFDPLTARISYYAEDERTPDDSAKKKKNDDKDGSTPVVSKPASPLSPTFNHSTIVNRQPRLPSSPTITAPSAPIPSAPTMSVMGGLGGGGMPAP